ncbi:hypothetical protein EMCRGX_G029236 [Ephydatia muelleri]
MPTYFQKPENAQNRAYEFIKVGNKESALEVLNDIIRSKKHRQWSKAHEEIMVLFMGLCVDLQRSAFAKDGLYQYRNICKEATTLSSFKNVVEHFLGLAAEKAKDAKEKSVQVTLKEKSDQAALLDVEDLDNVQTPESLLLSTVSGEGVKERTDRVLLTPWVKFLWESYRNILELLKNNSAVKNIYADVAKKAFAFCLEYQRRTEFRKLCDILKNHLTQAQRYQGQPHSLRFDDADTIQSLVDIRFDQLECSITIDLWQEAFKAIEEIHNLLGISGKAPRPGLLENFYTKQGKVYWMAKNKLFHAAALHKLFVLRKEQKKSLSAEEAQSTACQVLLATLCVPIEPATSESDRFLLVDDQSRINARKLAALLRMAVPPSRVSLLRDLGRYSVVQLVTPDLQQLYKYLEEDFNPLLLCKRVVPILEKLQEDKLFSQYIEPLKAIVLVRLVKQVSQVYQAIELKRLAELVPFTNPSDLERIVVEMACSNNIQVQIDHHTKSLRFGTDITFTSKSDVSDGPSIQVLPSEILCNQLAAMSQALQQAVKKISGESEAQLAAEHRKSVMQDCLQHARQDHRIANQRKNMIEARKEYIEAVNRKKVEKDEADRQKKEKVERKAEEERLKQEAEERMEAQKKKNMEELKKQLLQEKLNNLKATPIGAKALEGIAPEDLANMDADELLKKQVEQMEKDRREKETKQKTQEKKIDYFERAKRMEEIPLLEEQYKKQIVEDRRYHEEQDEERVSEAIKERKEGELIHKRMKGMVADSKAKLKDFEAKLDKLRAEKMEKRRKDRIAQRRADAIAAKKEALAAKKAEEDRIAKEKLMEEQRAKKKEEDEKMVQLEQQRLKQQQRDEEIERKLRAREEQERKEPEIPEFDKARDKKKPQLVEYQGEREPVNWRARDDNQEERPSRDRPVKEVSWMDRPSRDEEKERRDEERPREKPALWKDRPRDVPRSSEKEAWRRGGDGGYSRDRDDRRGPREEERSREKEGGDGWRGRDEERPRERDVFHKAPRDDERPRERDGDGWRGRDEERPKEKEFARRAPREEEQRPKEREDVWRRRTEEQPSERERDVVRRAPRDEERPRERDSGNPWRPSRDEERPREKERSKEAWSSSRVEREKEGEKWRLSRAAREDEYSRDKDRAPRDSWRGRATEPEQNVDGSRKEKPKEGGGDDAGDGWSVVKSGKR